MATIFIKRTPGHKDFAKLSHLLEGHVYDNVPKDDAEALVDAGLAEEFDENEEAHSAALASFDRSDFRKATPVKAAPGTPAPPPQLPSQKGATTNPGENLPVNKVTTKDSAPAAETDYESMSAEELHKIAADRNLEGRSGLNKADTIKLIQKDDAATAKKAKK